MTSPRFYWTSLNYVLSRIGLQSETIRARFHPRNSLEKQDFISFMKTTPLSIIFTELPSPAGDGRIIWGKVLEGQDKNEIFVNIKLADALRQRSIHAFTKHFWGSDFENRAGWGFEEAYLDFVLEAFCRREFADDPDKLWRIESLVARTERRKELSTEDIHRIVASVGKNTIWQVELDALPPLPSHITNDTYYRVRASDEGDMVEEEEEEPIDHSVWVVYDLRCRGR
ncbi:hypothetical protein FB45DRAFT_942122 [Roridomyces roridus]|uniref:Uncharacterized protein n=1 Tax=Roridomyces roridus TaxID=1738132 RepID=A0AAD7B5W4_9AGAR|nr:hypothetical protein FB45DRAFT_942122 [Roridomyces roridus]